MEFCKSELAFLEIFSKASNTKSFSGDKFKISTDTEKIYFSQFTEDVKLIYSFENKNKEQFEKIFSTNQFNAMIKLCGESDIISITNDEIKFGSNSSYKFETHPNMMASPDEYLNLVKDVKEKITLVDLNKISVIKSFISPIEELNCISLQDNYFISYDGQVIGISKSSNNVDKILYFPAIFFTFIDMLKVNSAELTILQSGEYYYLNIGGLNIFLRIGNYAIPYIFDDSIKSGFEHPYKVSFNRKDFINALQKISIIAQSSKDSTVCFTCHTDKILLESKNEQYGKEEVTATVDKELSDFYVILSSLSLINIANLFKGDIVTMFLIPTKDIQAIKIIDEKGEDYYVHIPFEYVD